MLLHERTNERRKDVPDEIVVIRLLVHGICEYCVGAWGHYVPNKAPPVSYNFSSPLQRQLSASLACMDGAEETATITITIIVRWKLLFSPITAIICVCTSSSSFSYSTQ